MRKLSILSTFILTLAAATAFAGDVWTIPPDAPSWARNDAGFAVSTVPAADVFGDLLESTGADVSNRLATRVEHAASTDWAVRLPESISVEPGEIFSISCAVKVDGGGDATTGVVLYAGSEAVSWAFGGRTISAADGATVATSKFIVPNGVDSIQPRVIGDGAATVWFADCRIERTGKIDVASPETLVCENDFLTVEAETANGSFFLLDKRSGRRWAPIVGENALFVRRAEKSSDGLGVAFDLLDGRTFAEIAATVRLEPDSPEVVVQVSAPEAQPLTESIAYPYPFATKTTERVVLPVNEGISFPTTEPEPIVRWIHMYGGHGLCMSFWGIVDDVIGAEGGYALAGIVETPDDAAIEMKARDSDEKLAAEKFDAAKRTAEIDAAIATPTLSIAQHWQGQKKRFGYARTLRLVSFDKGGFVAICKRYREFAKQIGLFRSFDEKERRNPNLREGFDRLIGAANVWCWDKPNVEIVKELQAAGIDRILWSAGGSAEELAAMNALDGVLTSRYDVYQDAMNPARFPELNGVHPDWTSDAWPQDLAWDSPDGRWTRGWEVDAKDPSKPRIPCGVLCDAKALPYAEKRISAELATKPYRARFIDTTTASNWRECWNPAHPTTRTESKDWRTKLLALMGERFDLVCGSETGIDASVPYCDFYEGMESLGPYRVPESGRDMLRVWTEVPAAVRKYQVGEAFRLPLFQLVYRECVVSYWYWGDYNNKLPELWRKRDLFNAAYGVPPMYMFTREQFEANRDAFVESYRIAEPVSRLTGRAEMVDYRILTADRTVQESVFANGVSVVANFGDKEYVGENGVEVAPKSAVVSNPNENEK